MTFPAEPVHRVLTGPLALTLALMAGQANAGLGCVISVAQPWQGHWVDKDGGRMVVRQADGVLDIDGNDAASNFRLVCIVRPEEPLKAQCLGDGVNFEGKEPARFIYRNTLELDRSACTMNEEWNADFPARPVRGKASFQRAAKPAANTR